MEPCSGAPQFHFHENGCYDLHNITDHVYDHFVHRLALLSEEMIRSADPKNVHKPQGRKHRSRDENNPSPSNNFSPKLLTLTLRHPNHFFDEVCKKARELHGLNATRYGYYVSYWRSRLSVFFTRSLSRQALSTKRQIYEGSQSKVQLEPVELARTF